MTTLLLIHTTLFKKYVMLKRFKLRNTASINYFYSTLNIANIFIVLEGSYSGSKFHCRWRVTLNREWNWFMSSNFIFQILFSPNIDLRKIRNYIFTTFMWNIEEKSHISHITIIQTLNRRRPYITFTLSIGRRVDIY